MTDRYHFHIRDGARAKTPITADLSTPCDARREALRIAAQHLYGDDGSLVIPAGWSIQVTDDAGQAVFKIQFGLDEGPGQCWPPAAS